MLEIRDRKTDADRKTFLSLEIRSCRNDTNCSSHRDLHFGILYVHFRDGVTNPTVLSPVVQGTRHKSHLVICSDSYESHETSQKAP